MMKIYDINGNTVTNPDLSKGFLRKEKMKVGQTDYIPETKEVSHVETVKTYANGGVDKRLVVDVPYSPAVEPRDKYEDVLIYREGFPEPTTDSMDWNEIAGTIRKGVDSV